MTCVGTVIAIFAIAICRLIWIATRIGKKPTPFIRVSVLAIAGSGGHTTELLRLLKSLSKQYTPVHYVFASSDTMSRTKIMQHEDERKNVEGKDFYINTIPRSREVAQPWLSSACTTLIAIVHAFPIIWNTSPDLILCTGPGTCIPLCLVGLLFKYFGLGKAQIVFVESICRVKTMSLSGRLLYHWADKIFVQWPELQKKYPKSIFIGRIV